MDHQWWVFRNGVIVAGPFKRMGAAIDHAEEMHRVSMNLNRYKDKWSYGLEKKEGDKNEG